MKKAFTVFVLGAALAGCALKRTPQKKKVIYLAPPPPKTFDLQVYPGSRHLFKVGDTQYTYKSMRVYIDSHKRETKGAYTVLIHLEGMTNQSREFDETVCFAVLMMDTDVAGYWGNKGGITPVRWENREGGSLGLQMMYRQCSKE